MCHFSALRSVRRHVLVNALIFPECMDLNSEKYLFLTLGGWGQFFMGVLVGVLGKMK